ncbi:unnamed protein product, partial [Didymodactylos carnosus]
DQYFLIHSCVEEHLKRTGRIDALKPRSATSDPNYMLPDHNTYVNFDNTLQRNPSTRSTQTIKHYPSQRPLVTNNSHSKEY